MFGFFFFFQAEDGIRDADVTGVQTCALPICTCARCSPSSASAPGKSSPGLCPTSSGCRCRPRQTGSLRGHLNAHRLEHVLCGVELLACVHAAALTSSKERRGRSSVTDEAGRDRYTA